MGWVMSPECKKMKKELHPNCDTVCYTKNNWGNFLCQSEISQRFEVNGHSTGRRPKLALHAPHHGQQLTQLLTSAVVVQLISIHHCVQYRGSYASSHVSPSAAIFHQDGEGIGCVRIAQKAGKPGVGCLACPHLCCARLGA
jgi:hypothetical protein